MNPRLVYRIIELLWAILVFYWILRSFGNKRTKIRQNRRLGLIYLILAVTVLVISPHSSRRIFLLPINIDTQLLGIVLCAAGLALAIWARIILGRNWSGFVVIKEDHELIQRGPYNVVRHPLYTGLILAILGTVIAVAPTLHGLLLVAAWLIAFYLKSRGEERILSQEFGEQYAAYRRRVTAAIIPLML